MSYKATDPWFKKCASLERHTKREEMLITTPWVRLTFRISMHKTGSA